MRENLTEIINKVDLPGLVSKHYPESGARPNTAAAIKASWRNDRNPSASLYRSDQGGWMLKDHATGDTFNAFQFLTDIVGESKEAVVSKLTGTPMQSPTPTQPRKRKVSTETIQAWKDNLEAKNRSPKVLSGRGFTPVDLKDYGIAIADNGDALIPIPDHHGEIVNVKRKSADPNAKAKYTYVESGVGAGPWHSPNFMNSDTVLIIEGELNAMIAHSVLGGSWSVMGMPGANHSLKDAHYLEHKDVAVYADADKPGREALHKWIDEARDVGAATVYELPAMDETVDFCDFAGSNGREALEMWLLEAIGQMKAHYEIKDRIVAENYTIQEMRENLERMMTGNIMVPTGYREIDWYTRGYRYADISLVCALPSMGKSIFIRDSAVFWAHRRREMCMLFTPDMDPESIFYYVAAKLTGIPLNAIETGVIPPSLIERYGDEDKTKQAFREAFDDCIINLSRRLILSEVPKIKEVEDRVQRAQDKGVTLFFGDYLQMFDPKDSSGKRAEGVAADEFKVIARHHKATFVFAVQLAKYKFPFPLMRDPRPYASDIEGSGKIYQNAAQVLMIYNREILEREYVDPEQPPQWPTDGMDNDRGKVRIYVRKNKRTEFGQWKYLGWNKDIVTFYDLDDPNHGVVQ